MQDRPAAEITDDSSDEATDNPLTADERNFYEMEKHAF
jgi:hypothetical protein